MNRFKAQIIVALAALLVPYVARGQSMQTAGGVVVDKMVATVNGGLITYSDILWQLALQPSTTLDNPRPQDLNHALQLLIDQRLIHQEVEKLPHIHATDAEVEAALTDLIRHFPSREEFQRRSGRVGLTAEQLREMLYQRVEIEKYLDFRFRSFTVITPKEVTDYYNEVYVPRFRQRSPGRIVPKMEQARVEIEETLREEKIASDMTKFLDEARARAEIVILSPP